MCITYDPQACFLVHGEVYECKDIEAMLQRGDGFFERMPEPEYKPRKLRRNAKDDRFQTHEVMILDSSLDQDARTSSASIDTYQKERTNMENETKDGAENPLTVGGEQAKVSVQLWAAKKLLGPMFDTVGKDLNRAYIGIRDRLIPAAARKVANLDDGRSANKRIVFEAARAGIYSSDSLSIEYLGGLVAASRTANGRNDNDINLVAEVAVLSSSQLLVHYQIYHCLNKALIRSGQHKFPCWRDKWVFYFHSTPNIDRDLAILKNRGLISNYVYDSRVCNTLEGERAFCYVGAQPTEVGILLYCAAYNAIMWWQAIGSELRTNFDDFDDVQLPDDFALDLEDLLARHTV